MTTVQSIMTCLEQWAPLHLAASWDNVGLQIGSADIVFSEIVIAMDVDEDVLAYIKDKKHVLVITHHPLFFKPLAQLRYDQDMGKIISQFVLGQHVLYSAHTNLDAAEGGVNDCLVTHYGLNPKDGQVISDGFGKVFFDLSLSFDSLKKKYPVRLEGDIRDDVVERLAFCCGSGHGFIQSIIDLKCDTLVTGEVTYHDQLRCKMNGIRVMSLGHKESEIFVLNHIQSRLLKSFSNLKTTVFTV